MSQTKKHLPTIYNPDNLTKTELIDSFVIRTWEFEEIFGMIKKDAMEFPPQHIIIQGQRGTGKTTLMLRIYYAIKDDKNLNKWLIPIKFDEEQYGIRTLAKFWFEVAEYLETESQDFIGIVNEMEKCEDHKNCEEKCFDLIKKKLNEKGKKIVIFLDNFGDMARKFKERELQRLREILMSSPELRLIAASSVVLEFTYDYSKPFYEFFKVYNLKNLNQEEAKNLVRKLGESYKSEEIERIIENEPQRLEALRRLTGGVPRTIVLLYEIFVDNETGNAFKDLEMTLDRVTPLYKHRMDDLPTQQQEIVDIIALNWDAISVKEIAAKTDIESKAISAQLKLLEKNNIVSKETTSTKNHYYRLSERFFNVWYLMRYGKRKHKNKVRFLVEFLEEWCTPEQLLNVSYTLKKSMQNGIVYEKYVLYMTEALARTSLPIDEQDSLIKETRKYLQTKESDLVEELSDSDYEIYEEIIEILKTKNEDLALNKVTEIKGKTVSYEYIIGSAFLVLKQYKKVEEYYEKAIKNGDVSAMYNLAVLYQQENANYQKAEKYYLKAIDKGDGMAMYNLALLYEKESKDYKKAEKYYLMAIEIGLAVAANNLALLYEQKYQDYIKAEEYYLKAIEKGHIISMYNLALMYQKEYKDYKKAEEYYLKAIEFRNHEAMNNLALLYHQEYKDYKKAKEYYLMAIENGNSNAMNNLAVLFFENKEHKKEALTYVHNVINLNRQFIYLHTFIMILLWNNEIENAISIGKNDLFTEENINKWKMDITEVLNFFIAKKQYNFIYKLFQENKFEIKEKYKPVYYALLSFMGEKYSDEFKKMGSELKETVDEIITEINRLSEEYK